MSKTSIIIERCDDSDPGQKQAATKEESHADQNDQGQDIGQDSGRLQRRKPPGLIQEDIMSE